MLTENKFSKYLMYAIGEIILVVIGILIALQVNNWNENRKLNLAWKTYTKSLIEDLQQDTVTLNEVIKFIENDSIYLEKLMVRLSSPNTTIDSLKKIARFELNYDSKSFRPPNNKTFLAMQSNGTVEFFEKDTYNMLLKLQSSQSIIEQIIKANNSLFREELSNFMSKYSSSHIKTIVGPLMDHAWQNAEPEELFRTVQGFMASKKGMNRNSYKRYTELLQLTEKVLSKIIESP